MTRFEIASPVLKAEFAKPYVYGESDCFFLGCRVADAFNAAHEMVSAYAGSYTTLMGAQLAMKRRGFDSITAVLEKHLDRVAPALAQYGDLAVLDLDGVEHVAVCVGDQFLTRTEQGRASFDLAKVKAAFRT